MKIASQKSAAPKADPAAATRGPRRQRGHDRVESLLAAAAEVFAERGFEPATMTEIAARAESAIGSLYQFFPTKDALAQALMRTQADALIERLAALEARAATLALDTLSDRLCLALVEFRAAHPSFAGLAEAAGVQGAIATGIRARIRERLAAILAPHAAPALRPARLAAVALVVQQTMKAAVALQTEPPATRAAAMRELRQMLRGYLRDALGGANLSS